LTSTHSKTFSRINEIKPDSLNEDDFKEDIACGKIFLYGFDKHNRPIVYVKAANHFPSDSDNDALWKLIVHVVRRAENLLPPPPYNQFIAVYDRNGFTRSNFDLNFMKRIVHSFHTNFPGFSW
jgi:hypothetical protein